MISVRLADEKDIDNILLLASKTDAFEVNDRINFYEKEELIEWTKNRKDNLIIIAEFDNSIIGFSYSKVMSSHWVMVDNFYVLKDFRNHGVSKLMRAYFESILEERKIKYVSMLIEFDKPATISYAKHIGFVHEKNYVWFDMFLESKKDVTI